MSATASRFMRTCFRQQDWLALVFKDYDRSSCIQRVCPLTSLGRDRTLDWPGTQNSRRSHAYVSVNALTAGTCSRTRRDVSAIRHVFLDVDDDAPSVLREIEGRSEIPAPSYVVHTSRNRAHVLWRVRDFDVSLASGSRGGLRSTSVVTARRPPRCS